MDAPHDHGIGGDITTCCNARCVTSGASFSPLALALLLQAAGVALFFAFPAYDFISKEQQYGPMVVGIIFGSLSLLFFMLAAITDPGLLPRAQQPLYYPMNSEYMRPPRTQSIMTPRGRIQLKYCDLCRIFRPPRTHHCVVCNNCVVGYDHHCPWLSNDVAERNYRYYFGFLLSICSFQILCVICCCVSLARDVHNVVNVVGSSVLLVLASVTSLSTFALLGLHTYLISQDMTTYEMMRREDDDNGFRCAGMNSVLDVLIGPRAPSLVRESVIKQASTLPVSTESALEEVSPSVYSERYGVVAVV